MIITRRGGGGGEEEQAMIGRRGRRESEGKHGSQQPGCRSGMSKCLDGQRTPAVPDINITLGVLWISGAIKSKQIPNKRRVCTVTVPIEK